MSEDLENADWSVTTFDGSRRDQLRRARTLTVRQRLEAMDELNQLSDRMRFVPKRHAAPADHVAKAHEPQAEYLVSHASHELILGGCTLTPMANYLKALGVLRLLTEQKAEFRIAGYWKDDRLVLCSPSFSGQPEIDREIACKFFLEDYRPSPLVTPWNGRGGFLEGEDEEEGEGSSRAGAQMVHLFSTAGNERFVSLSQSLRAIQRIAGVDVLNSARAALKRLVILEKRTGKAGLSDAEKEEIKFQEKAVKNAKAALLIELRNSLPDSMLDWFDACLALTNDEDTLKPVPVPLLGAGGLDGSMDFGVNYLKRINDIFDSSTGEPRVEARQWLTTALFGDVADGLISTSPQDKKDVSVGQFNPGKSGGVNSGAGFSEDALLNPWDTLLQLEGAVVFASSITRRLEGQGGVYASLPFTVQPQSFGEALAMSDESPKGAKRRTAEMWLPIWKVPATYSQLKGLFREGRITLRGKTVTKAFDFARALAELGSSRGVTKYRRTALLKRSGDAFFALDLGEHAVAGSRFSSLVADLEEPIGFLSKFQSFVRSKTPSGEWRASAKLRRLSARLDGLLVQMLGDADRVLEVLVLLGEIQTALSNSKKAREAVPPVSPLSERWVQLADDGTPAFRIARALAGLNGMGEALLPMRAQLFPVHPRFNQWMEDARKAKNTSDDKTLRLRLCTGLQGRLPEALAALLTRRLWLAERFEMPDKPLYGPAGARIDDVLAFLRDDAMDSRIAALLQGLCLCEIPLDAEHETGEGAVPAAFALLKLCLTPDAALHRLKVLGEEDRIPVSRGMLAQLAAGNTGNRAVQAAWRRLRASGLSPAFSIRTLPQLGRLNLRRVAAALQIPLRFSATAALARSVLRQEARVSEAV